MRAAGLAIAVKNARAEVKKESHYITPNAGGDGALRDAVEFVLKAQGKWKEIVEAYIGERSPSGPMKTAEDKMDVELFNSSAARRIEFTEADP